MKKILSAMRRAVTDFHMIEDGDKIAVGISGGKDSLILFEALYLFSKFSPEKFSLIAVNINMGFKDTSEEEMERLRAYFREREVPFFEEKTDIAEIIFEKPVRAATPGQAAVFYDADGCVIGGGTILRYDPNQTSLL